MTCPTCGQPFEPTGRRRYCSDACRAAAYRRRRDAAKPVLAVPKAQPRRPITVYDIGPQDLRRPRECCGAGLLSGRETLMEQTLQAAAA